MRIRRERRRGTGHTEKRRSDYCQCPTNPFFSRICTKRGFALFVRRCCCWCKLCFVGQVGQRAICSISCDFLHPTIPPLSDALNVHCCLACVFRSLLPRDSQVPSKSSNKDITFIRIFSKNRLKKLVFLPGKTTGKRHIELKNVSFKNCQPPLQCNLGTSPPYPLPKILNL